MSRVIADSKLRIGLLCISVFLYCSHPSYSESPQKPAEQTASPINKEAQNVTPLANISSKKDKTKKATVQGVKDTKVGPPPANVPLKKKSSTRTETPPPSGFVKLIPWENLTTHGPLPLRQ